MTPALPQLVPLSLPQYALKARETNRFEASPNEFDNLRFGYFGETGGLLASVKKSGRDQLTEPQSALAAEELGDALWYLVSTARLLGISPDDLGEQCIRSLRKRFNDSEREPSLPVSFRQIDGLLDTYKEGWDLDRVPACASICEQCADSCSRLRDPEMAKCADACRRCADSCADMSPK